jgi:RimJ/RimL family protein N-acetyltransferase
VLRPAQPADLDALTVLARHPEVAGTIATDAADGLAAALDDDAGELLVIEHDGVLVGGVRWVLIGRRSRIADIRSLMLDPAARGRGLALAAVRELAGRLLDDKGLHRVEAEVYGFNEPALRVFDRAGFVREGVRRRAYDRAGGWQDGIRFGLLNEDRQ